jgi:hypothetical protein
MVLIVAIFDLLGQMRAAFADPELGNPCDTVHRLRLRGDHLFSRELRHVALCPCSWNGA